MRKPKIGLLGLTLEFYEKSGPELREGRNKFVREKLVPSLSPIADVSFDGAVFTRESVEKTMSSFENESMDAILVVLLSYSQSLVSAPALKRTHLPIIVWNTQELFAVDESYSDAELFANHGVHGTHDLCNVLMRAGVPFGYATGHYTDKDAITELGDFFSAAYALNRLRHARIGLLGYPFPGMGDFGLDTTHLAMSLGCQWDAMSVSEYVKRCETAKIEEIENLIKEYRKNYDIASNITAEDLIETARAEVALRGMIGDRKLDAFTYQFLAFGEDERVGTLPFVAASRLLVEGIGFGGEGDMISAVGTALLGWLNPPSSFTEMFTIDFAGNAVFLSHMGEANVAMSKADAKPQLVKRPSSLVSIRGNQLALASGFAAGEATIMALTISKGGKWRIIASNVTIEKFGPLKHLVVPHSKIKPKGDVREFLTQYALAGGPHHFAICFGDARRKLKKIASMMSAEYIEI